jgi:hypothetical protein
MKDLTNKIFGRLKVIKRLPVIKNTNKKPRSKWLCQCSCGNTVEVLMDCLMNGHTTSCGCLRKETAAATKHDLIGQQFGLLTVISETPKRRLRNIIWHCKCSCQTFIDVDGSSLVKGHTKSCGCLQQQKASKTFHAFNKAYRLVRGYEEDELITTESNLIRQAITISGIKQVIKQRDNYTCVLCQSNNKLCVHHIEPFSINKEKQFDEFNLITLCESCHKLVHNNNYKQLPDKVLTEQLKATLTLKLLTQLK